MAQHVAVRFGPGGKAVSAPLPLPHICEAAAGIEAGRSAKVDEWGEMAPVDLLVHLSCDEMS